MTPHAPTAARLRGDAARPQSALALGTVDAREAAGRTRHPGRTEGADEELMRWRSNAFQRERPR